MHTSHCDLQAAPSVASSTGDRVAVAVLPLCIEQMQQPAPSKVLCCTAPHTQQGLLQVGRRPVDRTSDDEVISLLLHAQSARPAPAGQPSPRPAAGASPEAQVRDMLLDTAVHQI